MEARVGQQRYLHFLRNESGIKTHTPFFLFLLHNPFIEYSELLGYCQLIKPKFFVFDLLFITGNQTKNSARVLK